MKIRRLLLSLLILPLLVVVADLGPEIRGNEAKAAPLSGIFKVSGTKTTVATPGCPGCPEQESLVPQYEAVTGSALAGALEIDTNRQSSWSNGVTSTIDGGCAITATRGLKCWGDNKYGQLGDGTTTSSNTPVDAVGVSNVSDVAAGATRTCVVTGGSIKCTGNFWWPGLVVKKSLVSVGIDTIQVNGSSTDWSGYIESGWACQVLMNGEVVSGVTYPSSSAYTNGAGCGYVGWKTLVNNGELITDAAEVFIYGDSENWQSETPTICYRSTSGRLRCATIVPPVVSTTNPAYPSRFDCGGAADDFESTDESTCPRPYKRRYGYGTLTTSTASSEIRWEDSAITDVVDVDVSSSSYGGAGTICVATGASAKCTTYNPTAEFGRRFGAVTEIQGITSAEKVFVTSYGNSGLCVFGAGLLSCGNGTWDNGIYGFPTEVTAVGFMEKPLSIVYSGLTVGSMSTQKLYIITASGILATDPWAFNSCVNCYSQSNNSLSPITAFKAATTDTYYVATGVGGATDSINLIPMSYETGSREALSSKGITVKTSSGAVIAGAKVTWTAPDIPGTLRSSATLTNNTTNDTGFVRFYGLRSGPVTLTISGGTSGGSYLQAAIITVTLRPDETATATVPDPGTVVDRTIRVQLPDKTPVPNAIVTLRNNYLQYSYANSGLASSTWSARAPETNLFNTVTCIYCYVPPPVYITGADGSVTFPSYVPTTRSTAYDLGISYDDSVINQSLLCRVTPSPCLISQVDQTFTLGFMATVQTQIADQDTSTPNQVDVVPSADGVVSIPLQMADRDGPLDNSSVEAEDVCGTLLNGGLWSGSNSRSMAASIAVPSMPTTSTSISTTSCSTSVTGATVTSSPSTCPGGVMSCSTSPMTTTTAVTKSAVMSFAACTKTTKTTTDAKGKATLTLCPTQSGFFRIRGTGALPSREICVKVNGVACVRTTSASTGGISSAPTTTPGYSLTTGGLGASSPNLPRYLKPSSKVRTMQYLRAFVPSAFGGAIKISGSGACKIVGQYVVAASKAGTCRVTVSQVLKGSKKVNKRTFVVPVKAR